MKLIVCIYSLYCYTVVQVMLAGKESAFFIKTTRKSVRLGARSHVFGEGKLVLLQKRRDLFLLDILKKPQNIKHTTTKECAD